MSDSKKNKLSATTKKAWVDGKHKGIAHTVEAKEKISIAALASTHRRLLKSTRVYISKTGESVLLDSSWEEALAVRLDELGIDWIRPTEPIIWKDSMNRDRKYFPDFYLPEFEIFLEPKNPAAAMSQSEKVEWLLKNRKDVVFLMSLQECNNFALSSGP